MARHRRRLAVLGGCGGIGRGLVTRALDEGWRVAVLDLPASLARHAPPAGVPAYPVDATAPADLGRAAAAIEAAWGGLDGVVNLAGFMLAREPLAEMAPADFGAVLHGNVDAAFLASRALLPLLRRGEQASLVHIASGLARSIRPHFGAYAAAKAAMIALAKTLAIEEAPRLRVNVVAPGAVDTAFLRGGTGRSDESGPPSIDPAAYAAIVPLGRMAQVADILGPILFLLGPDSRFMTGQVLWVNGGSYMP
jgi:NAD(P)-dependent dehydrogenase (short-subunit alcohol dehydrogenase family)